MKKKRIIPVILLKNGWIVQSKEFSYFQNLGNPSKQVDRFSEWMADELIYLDITREGDYHRGRQDLQDLHFKNMLEIIGHVAKSSFMPVTFGGKIRTLNDVEFYLKTGADKVSLNSIFFENLTIAKSAALEFGSQCVVGSVDYRTIEGRSTVFSSYGQTNTQIGVIDWCKRLEDNGVGEILLNSIDRDGQKNGFDIELLATITHHISIPVIACGGAGSWEHFADALTHTNVDALAAANIFQHVDQSLYLLRRYLFDKKFNVREPKIFDIKDPYEEDDVL